MPYVQARGIRFHYEEQGLGPPLVCLPGALGSARTDFGPQLADLAGQFRVIAPDPRGYGRSRPPQRDFPLDFLQRDADDMAALMAALGAQAFFAAGWSDGATTAVLMALTHPERVNKLVIWGGNSYLSAEDVERVEKVRYLSSWSSRMRQSLEAVYGDSLQELWACYCDGLQALLQAGGEICRQRLARISCPTLILHGEQDPLVPGFHPRIFAQQIPNAQSYSFPTGRHNIHLAHQQEFNRVVLDFLGGAQPSPQ